MAGFTTLMSLLSTAPLPRRTAPFLQVLHHPAVFVAVVAVVAFGAALAGGFVWDDTAFLPGNQRLDDVAGPWVFFYKPVWAFAKAPIDAPLYRPLFVMALWAGHHVFGASPLPWHLWSVLLHAANSALVYLLARRLSPGGSPAAAWAGALLFAIHPVHVEAVAWVMAFGHPLSTAFVLAAAHAQVSIARGGSRLLLIPLGAALLAAMFTGEVALAGPVVLLGIDRLVRGKFHPGTAATVVATTALSLLARAAALRDPLPLEPSSAAVLRATTFLAAYVKNLVFPWPQPVYLTVPPEGVATTGDLLVAGGAIVSGIFLLLKTSRGQRGLPALALLWVAAGTAPLIAGSLNARPMFAPRGLYLASVGLALLASWAVGHAGARVQRRSVRALGALVLAAGVLACNVLSHAWRDDETVYGRILRSDPSNSAALVRLGELRAERNDDSGAEALFRAAIETASDLAHAVDAQEALATHLGRVGRLTEAREMFLRVASQVPDRASTLIGLGNVALLSGRAREARGFYARALELDPGSPEARYNLALAERASTPAPPHSSP